MFIQHHRKIELTNSTVKKFYSNESEWSERVTLRRILDKYLIAPSVVKYSKKNLFIEEVKLSRNNPSSNALDDAQIREIGLVLIKLHSVELTRSTRKLFSDEFTKDGKYHPLAIFNAAMQALTVDDRARNKKYIASVNKLEKQFRKVNGAMCLIHSDLSRENVFIDKGNIKFVDWDDSRVDLPLVDIYGFFMNFRLSSRQEEVFWSVYPKPYYWSKDLDLYLKHMNILFKQIPEPIGLIIPTYNRCPYKTAKLNPLYVTVESLLVNDTRKIIRYIIIGDDASKDNTYHTYQTLKNKFSEIKIIYFRNKKKLNASATRRKAIKLCPPRLFLMSDDDCIFPSNFIRNSYNLYKKIAAEDRTIAVLNIPFANKSFKFNGRVDVNQLGQIYIHDHWVYHNFDKLPIGVGNDHIKVSTFDGIFIGDKEKILTVGSYENLNDFIIDYAEHVSMSWRVVKGGYNIYHAIGEKFLVNHLKYGSAKKNFDYSDTPKKYLQIIKRSNKVFTNSGDRLSSLETIESIIASFIYFYFCVSLKEGVKHIDKELEYLSQHGQVTKELLLCYTNGVLTALKALRKRKIIKSEIIYREYMNHILAKYLNSEMCS